MSEPRCRRIQLLAAFAVLLAAVPGVGQMNWSKALPSTSPQVSCASAMAFDAGRKRTVLYLARATWEWNGRSWTWRTPSVSPSGRTGQAMAYDAARRQVVLFGGTDLLSDFDDTWVWDGSNWTRCTPNTRPPGRFSHAMAYDAVRQKVVLFGGYSCSNSAALDDTWEWDGRNWTRAAPATSPMRRSMHGMAYDAVRQRVVLFGGDTGGLPDDTWEWDGKNWTERKPTTKPSGRLRPAMAYDSMRQRIVLFGGRDRVNQGKSDTWEWDGQNWTSRKPAVSPKPLPSEAMVYDAARQRTVLLAGFGVDRLNHTWEWDGSNWKRVTPPTHHPSPRYYHALACDAARRRIVLFGGFSGVALNDTWEWDGHVWSRQQPAASPSARLHHAMAYDASRRRVVLFGGSMLNDTWEYDGATWTQAIPALSPPARIYSAMAYDAARRRVLLFGGLSLSSVSYVNDTWEWDGKTWSRRQPATSPSVRQQPAMAYDASRRRIVLFGGIGGAFSSYLNDTWEWDGSNWRNVTPPTGNPAARIPQGMAYDAARQRVVLYGGYFVVNGRHYSFSIGFNDTWEWDGSIWTQAAPPTSPPGFGSSSAIPPAPGLHQDPIVHDPARGTTVLLDSWYRETWTYAPTDLTASTHLVSVGAGGNVKLSLDAGAAHAAKNYWVLGCIDSGGPRGIPSLQVNLRLNPDVYFWSTTQVPNPLIANAIGTLDASGKATATIRVPPLPSALIGWRFYHAYVVFRSSLDHASTPVPLTLAP